MSNDTRDALEWLRDVATFHRKEWLRETASAILAHIAKLEARAKEAEAKVAAAEERGLVFNMLPDGRLDFCAIREGSRLWDGKAAEAREATLREALAKIDSSSWSAFYVDSPAASIAAQIIDEMQRVARQALAAAPALARQMGGGDAE